MKVLKFTKNKKVEEITHTDLTSTSRLSGNESFPSSSTQESRTKFVKITKEKKKPRRGCRIVLIVLSICFVLFGVLGILAYNFLYTPYLRIKKSVDNIQANGQLLLQDFDNKDLSNIDSYFAIIKSDLNEINSELDRFEFLSSMEYTKGYYENFQVLRSILDKTSNLMDETLPDLKNLLKVTGFRTEKNQPNTVIVLDPSNPDAEEESAFSLILKELPQYLALYEEMEPKIIDIFNEVKRIDTNYIPPVGSTNYAEAINKLNDFSIEFPSLSKQTRDFLSGLPAVIGSSEPARYLVVLQNETEMRSSGGLLTAYGHLTMSNGEIGEITLSDMWNLEKYVSWTLGIDVGYRNIYGQDYLMYGSNGVITWQCGSNYLRAQDSGIYPDLKLTMNMLSDYYNVAKRYDPVNYPEYDYILIINNHFAETLISLLEPLEVEGFGKVTADSLYAFIKAETDSEENRGDPERKSIIKDIANAAKKKLFEFKMADMPKLINAMIKSIQAKDIGITAPNHPELDAYLNKYGFNGEIIKDFNGDYFQLAEAQNCSLKINRWLRNEVTQTINISDTGDITKHVYTKWYQPEVYQDAYYDQYDIGGRFTYRAWVRLFMPNGSSNLDSDGYQNSGYLYYYPKEYYDSDVDKYASDNIIQFDHRRLKEEDPIPTQELNVTYSLPADLNYAETGTYRLLVQKHPGKSWGEKNTVVINHQGQEYKVEFTLDRDKVISYRDGVISVDNYNKNLDFILNLVEKVPWDKIKE